MSKPLAVGSVEEEDAVLGACLCGREWRLAAEDVVPIKGRWYDAVVVTCSACGSVRRALFDITSFFAPPGNAWALCA